MARRQQLSEDQLAELFDPPVEQRELVRHYTLPSEDLAAAQRCRGDHNRLGYALMLCYLRHPGRALRAGERPPHLSDRYAPFFTKLIAAAASEALHVLDALLYHQSEVPVGRHHTDGGGDSDHVFALCSLLGFQFSPRIPDLKHRRLYSFGKPSDYPTLEPMIGGRINLALICAHWKAILRIVASIRTGTVTAR